MNTETLPRLPSSLRPLTRSFTMSPVGLTLLKREFWEHKGGLFWAPLMVGAALLATALLLLFSLLYNNGVHINGQSMNLTELLQKFLIIPADFKARLLQGALRVIAIPLHLVMLIVTFFYALNCLYEERKDRSILFWRSLPVSDRKTVLAKVATALALAPLLSLAATLLCQLLFLLLLTVVAWFSGLSAWYNVWSPVDLLTLWSTQLLGTLVHSLWFAPVVAWLLLVSAYAKRSPFLIALLLPLGLTWLEYGINRSRWLLDTVLERFNSGLFQLDISQESLLSGTGNVFGPARLTEMFSRPELALGLLLAALLLYATIELRRRSGEI